MVKRIFLSENFLYISTFYYNYTLKFFKIKLKSICSKLNSTKSIQLILSLLKFELEYR